MRIHWQILGLVAVLVVAANGQETWRQDEFVIYLWNSPDVSDLDLKAQKLAQAGFTVVDWDPAALDVLQKYQLKAMIHRATGELAAKIADHPAIWGYHCGDEPYPESQFAPLAQRIAQLHRADPRHPAFVNVLSTSGEFLRTYVTEVQPKLLSFDYYQWWWGSHRYFEKLEQFRDAALRARIPLGSCIETTANPEIESGNSTYLSDNAVKLRQSVYTNLAYGVKMIEWYSAAYMFQAHSVELTESGRDVAALNQEIKQLGKILVDLNSVDVFHSRPTYAGTRSIPLEHWLQVTGEPQRGPIVLGTFVDQGGVDYAMLVNSDYHADQTVSIALQSKWLGIAPWNQPKTYRYSVERFDRDLNQWRSVTSSSATGFTTVLEPGDGQLYRIHTEVEDPE